MERRTLVAGLGILLGASLIGYAAFGGATEEEEIRELFDRLAASVGFDEPIANVIFHGSALADRWEDILDERVEVRLREVNASLPSERPRLAIASAQALTRYDSFHASMSNVDVEIAEEPRVRGSVTVTATRGGAPESETRRFTAVVVRQSGDFLIRELVVEPAQD